jgi:hypothetical protein
MKKGPSGFEGPCGWRVMGGSVSMLTVRPGRAAPRPRPGRGAGRRGPAGGPGVAGRRRGVGPGRGRPRPPGRGAAAPPPAHAPARAAPAARRGGAERPPGHRAGQVRASGHLLLLLVVDRVRRNRSRSQPAGHRPPTGRAPRSPAGAGELGCQGSGRAVEPAWQCSFWSWTRRRHGAVSVGSRGAGGRCQRPAGCAPPAAAHTRDCGTVLWGRPRPARTPADPSSRRRAGPVPRPGMARRPAHCRPERLPGPRRPRPAAPLARPGRWCPGRCPGRVGHCRSGPGGRPGGGGPAGAGTGARQTACKIKSAGRRTRARPAAVVGPGDVGVAEVERDRAARRQRGQHPRIPGHPAGLVRCSASTATAATAKGLKAEQPQPGQDGAEAGGRGDGVEDVEAEGGAVGEHGEGAQPAGVVDGTVNPVLAVRAAMRGSLGSTGEAAWLGCGGPGPGRLLVDAYQAVSLRPDALGRSVARNARETEAGHTGR